MDTPGARVWRTYARPFPSISAGASSSRSIMTVPAPPMQCSRGVGVSSAAFFHNILCFTP